LIEQTWASEFAMEWIESWNSYDLDRILSHYVDDFKMSSPLIIERKKDSNSVLRGKFAIRDYWAIEFAATVYMEALRDDSLRPNGAAKAAVRNRQRRVNFDHWQTAPTLEVLNAAF
jgi:hypothetical protein